MPHPPLAAGNGIDYGDRCRAGIIIPSGNVIAEPEIRAMLPRGVGLYVTRLPLRGSSESELAAMAAGTQAAAELLAHAQVDRIVFHCTAVTTSSPRIGEELRRRIEETTGIPALATSNALLDAFAALGARRIVLLTPYVADVHERERRFLSACGIEVVRDEGLGVDSNAEMARIPPAALVDLALRNQSPEAEACFISCTALRTAGLIEPLEKALGVPVLTSNQAMVWHLLRNLGIPDEVPNYGRLFAAAGGQTRIEAGPLGGPAVAASRPEHAG